MPPESAIGILDGIRREVERGAVRTRNGLRLISGAEFAPPHPTPSDVIWSSGKCHVRRYRRDSPARLSPPVLCYLGLVGQPYVFDLYKDGSIVQMLMEWGFEAYVLDWGIADEQDAENTLETYLQNFFPQALDAVCLESGCDDVTAFAYCMGGVMTVQALAAQPGLPLRSVVSLAAPFDWSDLGAYVNAVREGKVDLEELLDASGNLPGALVRESFKRRKPTADIVNYANLWQHLWDDQYVEGYQAIGRFLHDHIPMPGATARQVVQQWIKDNGFVTDMLRLGGRRVSLANVRTPMLAVVAEHDDIAPVASTLALADVLRNSKVDVLRVNSGHVSLFAGRKAVKEVMPEVFSWIERLSEEARKSTRTSAYASTNKKTRR
jgi:polyhydroxyalkanoate synthase